MTSQEKNGSLMQEKIDNEHSVLYSDREIVHLPCVIDTDMLKLILSTPGGAPIPLSLLVGNDLDSNADMLDKMFVERLHFFSKPMGVKGDETKPKEKATFLLHGMEICDCRTTYKMDVPMLASMALNSIKLIDEDPLSDIFEYKSRESSGVRFRKINNEFKPDGTPNSIYISNCRRFQTKVDFSRQGNSCGKLAWDDMEPMPRLHIYNPLNMRAGGVGNTVPDGKKDHYDMSEMRKLLNPQMVAHSVNATPSNFHGSSNGLTSGRAYTPNGDVIDLVNTSEKHYLEREDKKSWNPDEYAPHIYGLLSNWFYYRHVSLKTCAIWFCLDETFRAFNKNYKAGNLAFTLKLDLSFFRRVTEQEKTNLLTIGRNNYRDHKMSNLPAN